MCYGRYMTETREKTLPPPPPAPPEVWVTRDYLWPEAPWYAVLMMTVLVVGVLAVVWWLL